MQEILSLRQENSKTFGDGGKRQLVVSMGAIHYKDNYASDEPWKDIDLTWVDNKITKAPYDLTLDDKKITIRNKKTDETTTIELMSVKPSGLKWEIVPDNDKVSFRHILPSSNMPFEASFKVRGNGYVRERAFDDDGELELEVTQDADIVTEKLSKIVDKLTKTERPAKGAIRVDPTWQVSASTDDVFRRLNTSYWSTTIAYCGYGGGHATYYRLGSGMRFQNVTIPNGSTIDTAKITTTAYTSRSGANTFARISAEDVDDAPTFADSSAAFDTRYANHTTAVVDWDNIPAQTALSTYDTPDISTVIQVLVDKVGWVSGQDMVLFIEDYDDRSSHVTANAFRESYSWDGDSAKAPVLNVTYTAPPTDYPVSLSAGLTVSTTIARYYGRLRTLSAGLTASVTIDREVSWNRATSPGLTAAVSLLRGCARTLSTICGLTVDATVNKSVAWGRAVTAGLAVSVSVAFLHRRLAAFADIKRYAVSTYGSAVSRFKKGYSSVIQRFKTPSDYE